MPRPSSLPTRPPPLAVAYHGVARVPLRQDWAGLFVPPEDIRRHIRALRRWGYSFVTFGELSRRTATSKSAEGLCALTFDDGFADNLSALLPLLDEEQVPCTVFVVSSWLGVPHPDAPWARTLTIEELVNLSKAELVEIGSHSTTHRDMSTLDYTETLDDFRRSKAALETLIERPVSVAAYPYGKVGADTARACADAGFSAACRISGEGSWDDPMNLPRQDMPNGSNRFGLWLKHRDRYEPLMQHKPVRLTRSAARRVRALRQRGWPGQPALSH